MQIDGKVVLITGASEGIGRACARGVSRSAGRALSLTARSRRQVESAGGTDALSPPAISRTPEVRRRVVDRTLERFGAIDILINNAGHGMYAPSWQAPLDEARADVRAEFFAPLAMIQLVVPHMRRAAERMIVNIGSIAGKVTLPWFTLYSASKYALGSLTDGLRMELRPYGIQP